MYYQICKNVTQIKRKTKDGTVSMVPSLIVFQDYNSNMISVDKFDKNTKFFIQLIGKAKNGITMFFFFYICYNFAIIIILVSSTMI